MLVPSYLLTGAWYMSLTQFSEHVSEGYVLLIYLANEMNSEIAVSYSCVCYIPLHVLHMAGYIAACVEVLHWSGYKLVELSSHLW